MAEARYRRKSSLRASSICVLRAMSWSGAASVRRGLSRSRRLGAVVVTRLSAMIVKWLGQTVGFARLVSPIAGIEGIRHLCVRPGLELPAASLPPVAVLCHRLPPSIDEKSRDDCWFLSGTAAAIRRSGLAKRDRSRHVRAEPKWAKGKRKTACYEADVLPRRRFAKFFIKSTHCPHRPNK